MQTAAVRIRLKDRLLGRSVCTGTDKLKSQLCNEGQLTTRPKSISASLPAWGPSVTLSRLPGWGSAQQDKAAGGGGGEGV